MRAWIRSRVCGASARIRRISRGESHAGRGSPCSKEECRFPRAVTKNTDTERRELQSNRRRFDRLLIAHRSRADAPHRLVLLRLATLVKLREFLVNANTG